MKKKILGAAMTLAAAVSMSLLAIPSATAVDDSLDDSLAVTTVEETTDDATPEAIGKIELVPLSLTTASRLSN